MTEDDTVVRSLHSGLPAWFGGSRWPARCGTSNDDLPGDPPSRRPGSAGVRVLPATLAPVIPMHAEQGAEGTETGVIEQMPVALPGHRGLDLGCDQAALRECITAAEWAARAARTCADDCLADGTVSELVGRVRALLNTADVCQATAQVLSRYGGCDPTTVRSLLAACRAACEAATAMCERPPAVRGRCRTAALACRAAERACRELLDSMHRPVS